MARLFFNDMRFDYLGKNPFSVDGEYDSKWLLIKVVSDEENRNISGKLNEKIYGILLSKCYDGWQFSLMDFIQYYGDFDDKNIIVAIDKNDYEEARQIYRGHCYKDRILRPYEPRILVHSTPYKLWNKINASGKLKSWKRAKEDGDLNEVAPIGRELNDPKEFSDYVMLGGMGYHNEIIVLSKQLGKLCYDINAEYIPGARIYLDAKKIAKDNLLIRDGIHLKAKGELEIEPYLLAVVTVRDLDAVERRWTPLIFSEQADKFVMERFNIKL